MIRRALLIANPMAGRGIFDSVCHHLVLLLEEKGFEVVVKRTTAESGSAQNHAASAASSQDLVIACGGDGTVHEVLQGIAGTTVPLGVLPFGTANALARNLLLPPDPVSALRKLLTFLPQEIPLGQIENATGTSYFTVMAGAGPDGALVRDMSRTLKVRTGRRAYYALAARHFLTRRFPSFVVEYRLTGSDRWYRTSAAAMMVSRIPDLGGLFKGLTTASRLHHPHLRMQLIASPAHLALSAWFGLGRLGLDRTNPWLSSFEVEELRCTPANSSSVVYAQVDGETAGSLPISVCIAASTAWLLMPPEMIPLQ